MKPLIKSLSQEDINKHKPLFLIAEDYQHAGYERGYLAGLEAVISLFTGLPAKEYDTEVVERIKEWRKFILKSDPN